MHKGLENQDSWDKAGNKIDHTSAVLFSLLKTLSFQDPDCCMCSELIPVFVSPDQLNSSCSG